MARRLKAFRHTQALTQENLAELWGVSNRTIARWERGEGRPQQWMRREIAKVESPIEWPTARLLCELIERRASPAMIYDTGLKVLAVSAMHDAWMHATYGITAVGVDWRRYMSEACHEMVAAGGGVDYMVHHGLMCMRGTYNDPRGVDGTFVPHQMYIDLTVVRIPDYGSLCVTVAREPDPGEALVPLAPYFMD